MVQPAYWVILGVVVVAYIGIRLWLYSDARTAELEEWIQLNNYSFQKENDPSIGIKCSPLSTDKIPELQGY